jgi:hypothetical protein
MCSELPYDRTVRCTLARSTKPPEASGCVSPKCKESFYRVSIVFEVNAGDASTVAHRDFGRVTLPAPHTHLLVAQECWRAPLAIAAWHSHPRGTGGEGVRHRVAADMRGV